MRVFPQKLKSSFLKTAVFCLISGILIALTVYWSGMNDEAVLVIPVEYSGLSNDLVVSSATVERITVHIQGNSNKINSVSKPVCIIDLSDAEAGALPVTLSSTLIQLPSGITINTIEPDAISVVIEERTEKELPVVVSHTGIPARGFRVAGMVAVPDKVTVAGPSSIVDPLDAVTTKPVDISGVSESIKKEVVVDIAEEVSLVLPGSPIIADISISEKIVSKKLTVPVSTLNGKAEITPSSADIEISGPENMISRINGGESVRITIDIKGLGSGVYVRRAAVNLPVDLTLVTVKPELFTLKIN